MRTIPVALALALALPAASLQGQYVGGGVVVHSGPVSAQIVFGPRPYYPPPRRVLVVHDYRSSVIVVGRLPHRGHGYWRHHGYRPATVWYDDRRDCFYPGQVAYYPGLRQVEVYERGGSYYRIDDRGGEDWGRHDRNRHGHSGWEHSGR